MKSALPLGAAVQTSLKSFRLRELLDQPTFAYWALLGLTGLYLALLGLTEPYLALLLHLRTD